MSQQTNSLASRLHQAFSNKINFKTILALFVFGMIIIVFVFSGLMGSQGGNLGMGVAATVNGEIVSIKQFQDQENRVSSYYSQMLGGQFENLIQKKNLQTEALNQLVDNSVAAQTANSEMILATDANIRVAIQDMPYFKKDGVFQSDLYKGVLANNGLTAGDFEKSMRQQISIQKVRDLFEASSIVTTLEKNVEDDLKMSKINLYYATLTADIAKKAEDVILKGTDLKSVEAFLTSQNLKLKETGLFEIANETVPVINSNAAFKAAMDLTKEKPVYKSIIKEGDAFYLIVLKDIKKDTELVASDVNSKRNEMLDKQKSYSQYQNWLENSKKAFSINKNTALIQQ